MGDKEDSVRIVKRVEDCLEQCNKVEKSETIKKCIQLLSLVNEESHEKAKKFYKEKITSYWKTIKDDLDKEPLKLSNSTFVIEHPLQVDFGKILDAASPEQKSVLALHFKSVAASIWPDEFPEPQNREAIQIDAFLENLKAFGFSQDPNSDPQGVIKNLKENTVLINQSKEICQAMASGNLDIFKTLDHCLKKLEETKVSSANDMEELKSLIDYMRDRPLDAVTALNVMIKLRKLDAIKLLKDNRKQVLENIPEEAKNSSTTTDVLNLLFSEDESGSVEKKWLDDNCQQTK